MTARAEVLNRDCISTLNDQEITRPSRRLFAARLAVLDSHLSQRLSDDAARD